MFSGVCWFRAFRLSGQGLGIAVIKDIPAHGALVVASHISYILAVPSAFQFHKHPIYRL